MYKIGTEPGSPGAKLNALPIRLPPSILYRSYYRHRPQTKTLTIISEGTNQGWRAKTLLVDQAVILSRVYLGSMPGLLCIHFYHRRLDFMILKMLLFGFTAFIRAYNNALTIRFTNAANLPPLLPYKFICLSSYSQWGPLWPGLWAQCLLSYPAILIGERVQQGFKSPRDCLTNLLSPYARSS